MEKVEIYLSKQKVFLFTIMSLIFVMWGFHMFMDAERNRDKWFGVLGVFIFSYIVYICVKILLFNSSPVVVINSTAVNINSLIDTTGINIDWKHIIGFSEIKIKSQRHIIIHVNNLNYWLEKEKDKTKKEQIKSNINTYGSPFILPTVLLQINHDELVKILNENLKKYKV